VKRSRPYRLAALDVALTQRGVHERGQTNWSPQVALYLRSTGINFPAAWCMAFVHWCFNRVGKSLGGGASVGNFEQWARENGEIVARPRRADLGCWDLTGDGWPDHVFWVVRVLRLGPWWRLKTIEGNTSPNTTGSQDNGGTVAVKTRVVRNATVRGAIFVRVHGRPKGRTA
jgi:hypothetical protein